MRDMYEGLRDSNIPLTIAKIDRGIVTLKRESCGQALKLESQRKMMYVFLTKAYRCSGH
jgi:hypothetical protein